MAERAPAPLPSELQLLVLSCGVSGAELAVILENLKEKSKSASSHKRRELYWDAYGQMISKTSSIDGPAFCFLTYKATADGSDGCVELIELTKRQRGLVNGGIEFLGHKIKPLIDGKPDPTAKTWVLAFSEEEAVAAWDDINFGEPCIGIFADGVQVLTRYKRVVCKGLSGLPKSAKEVEQLVSELAPEKPLRSISFVGSDPPTVNDYNCFIVGPSKLDKELPPTVGTIASTSNNDLYDAFLANSSPRPAPTAPSSCTWSAAKWILRASLQRWASSCSSSSIGPISTRLAESAQIFEGISMRTAHYPTLEPCPCGGGGAGVTMN